MRSLGHGLLLLLFTVTCAEPGPHPSEGEPVLKWRNVDVRGESVPVVDGSAVYNLEQATHIVSAVRKSDGSLMWRRTLPVTNPGADGYGLALSNGVLVVGDLDLFGLDAATGSILWKYQPSQGRNPGFGRLTVANGTIYCGSTSGHVFAVDPATGAERWIVAAAATSASVYGPVVVDGIVYASVTDFNPGSPNRVGAVAVDAGTGSLTWSVMAPTRLAGSDLNTESPVILGDRVFFGSITGVHIADRRTGTYLSALASNLFGPGLVTPHRPYAVGKSLLVASGSGYVSALDPAILERKWQIQTNISVTGISGDDQVAYIPQQGVLVAALLSSGVPKWTFKSQSVGVANDMFLAAPAMDESTIYLPGSKSVYALKRE